mgnify:CR=1 FL=1
MLDVDSIRKDFPFIKNGRIYFDSTATSLTPDPVLNKMLEYYREYRSNVGRGIYKISQLATEEYENARKKVAGLINAKPNELVFLRNSSEGLNLVANGIGLRRGDEIVTTIQEHHSNFIIWLRAKERLGSDVKVVSCNKSGSFNLEDFDKSVTKKTKIVSVTHVSNVLGALTPIKEIAKIAHEKGSLIMVDAAQSVPHMKIDVRDLGVDFLAFSGHKMCGPTGAGGLYIKETLVENVEPLCIGGGTIDDVGVDYYKIKKGPAKFEAGTPPIAEAIGLGEAANYLSQIGMGNISDHEHRLAKMMLDGLLQIRGVRVHGPLSLENKTGIFSFNISGIDSHDVAMALDASSNIMVRSGHHCALPLMKEVLNERAGSVRASVYLYNTEEEVNTFLNALEEISKTLS